MTTEPKAEITNAKKERVEIRTALRKRFSAVLFEYQVKHNSFAGEVAKLLGIQASALSTYLNCHHLPSLEEFIRICRVLGLDMHEVLNVNEQQSPSDIKRHSRRILDAHKRSRRATSLRRAKTKAKR